MAERLTLVCDRRGRGGHPCPNEARKGFKRTTIKPSP
jgi:hypothetical protein